MDISPPPGADLLRAFLTDPEHPDRSQAWLADKLGISQPSVSGWLTGKSRPEDAHREALEILTGIDRTSWRRASEHAVVERARRAVGVHAVEAPDTDPGDPALDEGRPSMVA